MYLSKKRQEKIEELEKNIGYIFKDKVLIDVALTHSSYTNEARGKSKSNERLEFLGDTILDMIVSEYLFKNYKNKSEGWLTRTRSRIVCTDSFAKASEKFELTKYLRFGQGEKKQGGNLKKHVKADTFEAMCAAIYLDSSYDILFSFLRDNYSDDVIRIINDDSLFLDYKTRLQEYYNQKNRKDLSYNLILEEGPEHDKTFTMEVRIGGRKLARGSGKNKKTAEQMAAKAAYERIHNVK